MGELQKAENYQVMSLFVVYLLSSPQCVAYFFFFLFLLLWQRGASLAAGGGVESGEKENKLTGYDLSAKAKY